MAVEDIGLLVPTKIPGLADAADIQEALRVYHYGGSGYQATAAQTSLPAVGIARRLLEITDDITALENRPSSGGDVATNAPVAVDFTPSGIPNGYIWVDSDGSLGGAPTGATAVFTNSAPTSSITTGTIWVDKDSTAITANPFIPSASINAKGDLLAGSANDSVTVLSVGTNGQVLKANSATTSGLEWAADSTYAAPTIGSTSIASGATVTTIAGLTLTTPTINGGEITATGGTPRIHGIYLPEAHFITFEGATNNEFETVLTTVDPTADRTISLPDATDTLVGRATTDTLTNKTLTDPKINLAFDAETASYIAVLANNGQVVTMDNGSANTFSIPTNASVAFPIGTQINVLQIGAGQTTIQAVTAGTTTILSTGASAAAPKLRARYSMATCIKSATDTWYIVGDIA